MTLRRFAAMAVLALGFLLPPLVQAHAQQAPVAVTTASPAPRPCTDTLALQIRVQRDTTAMQLSLSDVREAARTALMGRGYLMTTDSAAGGRAVAKLDLSLQVDPAYYRGTAQLTRHAVAASVFISDEGSLAPGAGPATIGGAVQRLIERSLKDMPVGACMR